MRNIRQILPFLVLAALLPSVALPLEANADVPTIAITQVFWGTTKIPTQPEPGDSNVQLTVVVQNTSNDDINSIVATLTLSNSPFKDRIGKDIAVAGISSTISPGESSSLEFLLDITKQAKRTTYNLPLNMKVRTTQFATAVDVNTVLSVPLKGKSILQIDSTTNILEPGLNRFDLRLRNTGTAAASSVEVVITIPSPLARVDGDNKIFIPIIEASGIQTTSMLIFAPTSAVDSAVQMTAKVTFRDAYGFIKNDTLVLGILIGSATVSPGKLAVTSLSWGNASMDEAASPGDKGASLFVTVRNMGDDTISALQAKLFLSPPFTNSTGGDVVTATLAEIAPAQSGNFRFSLNIDKSAEVGTYRLSFSTNYLVKNELSKPVTYIPAPAFTTTVNVDVLGKSIITISTQTRELASGTTTIMDFAVSNEGSAEAVSLDVTLQVPASSSSLSNQNQEDLLRRGISPLVLTGKDNRWHFDSLKPAEDKRIRAEFTVSPGVVGTFEIGILIEYTDIAGLSHEETRSIGVKISPKAQSSLISLTSFRTVPEVIKHTESFILNVQLKNLGNKLAQDVVVEVFVPPGFSTPVARLVDLGDMPVGSSQQVAYDIQATPSALAGAVHDFDLDITFTDGQGTRQKTRSVVTIPVHGEIDFIAYDIEQIPSSTPAGSDFSLSLTLLNTGSIPAFFTNVSVVSQSPFKGATGSSSYLGQVDPDGPIPITLDAQVGLEAGDGIYPLRLVVQYEDEFLSARSIELSIPVTVGGLLITDVSAQQDNANSILTELPIIGVIAVAALVGAISVLRLRRRRASRPSKKI